MHTRFSLFTILPLYIILADKIDKPAKNENKPGFMIGTKIKNKEFYFFVEVKRANTARKYQSEDEYTKLMKQMNESVEDQLYLGLKIPTSLSLLIEGQFSSCMSHVRKTCYLMQIFW